MCACMLSFLPPPVGRGGWGRGRGGGGWGGDDYMHQDEPVDRRDGPPGWKKSEYGARESSKTS